MCPVVDGERYMPGLCVCDTVYCILNIIVIYIITIIALLQIIQQIHVNGDRSVLLIKPIIPSALLTLLSSLDVTPESLSLSCYKNCVAL